MSIFCRNIRKWTCDSQSAREPESTSSEDGKYSAAEWAQALNNPGTKGHLEDCVAAVEMQIIKNGAYNELEDSGTSACNINDERAELLTVDFTHPLSSSYASSESSAAIPVPPRSLSRQSSVNCATSATSDLTTNGATAESQIDWNGLEGDCTLHEEPYFTPLKSSSQTGRFVSSTGDNKCNIKETENKQGCSLSSGMKGPVSTSPTKQCNNVQPRNTSQTRASGLRSFASSGYISDGCTYSYSWKPRRPLMSPIPGDWFVGTHKSCPSLAYIVDYSLQVGLRSKEPSRIQKASGDDRKILPKSEGCLDTASAPCSDLGYHSRGEFNSMCRYKAGCRCIPQSSRKKSIISATGDQSSRGRSVDQSSSVETCDASTSPHLPLQWFCPRMARSMEDLQHNDINPVRVSDKPSDKDHSQGPTQAAYEHDVYLACSTGTEDTSWGEKLLNILEESPYNFRTYMYDRDCVLGRSTIDDRANQIENSFKFICLLSPSFLRSGLCRKDLQLAQHEQTNNRPFSNFVIPLQIAQCKIPVALGNLQHCEAWTEGPSKIVVDMVVRAIRDST